MLYNTKYIYRVEKGELTDTIIINKKQFESNLNYYLPPIAAFNFKQNYVDDMPQYPIEFLLKVEGNDIFYGFYSCSTCPDVTMVKSGYGERLIKTDLTYEQYSFWRTFGLTYGVTILLGLIIASAGGMN